MDLASLQIGFGTLAVVVALAGAYVMFSVGLGAVVLLLNAIALLRRA